MQQKTVSVKHKAKLMDNIFRCNALRKHFGYFCLCAASLLHLKQSTSVVSDLKKTKENTKNVQIPIISGVMLFQYIIT